MRSTILLTAMLLPITLVAEPQMTKQEMKMVAKVMIEIVKKRNLNRETDQMTIVPTDQQMEAMLAAIKAGNKAEQERIVREIVAQPTIRTE